MKKILVFGIFILLVLSTYSVLGIQSTSGINQDKNSEDYQKISADLKVTYVKGGFGFKMCIKNFGDEDALNVNWLVSWDGSVIIWDMQDSGYVSRIPAGEHVIVRTNEIFGLGPTTIKFSINASNSETYSGEIDGFLIGSLLGLWGPVYSP